MEKHEEIEYNTVLGRISQLETTRLQLLTFFGTASITVFGLALKDRQPALVLLSAALIAPALTIDCRIRRQAQIYYFRGLQIQRKHGKEDPESFLELHPSLLAAEARKILALQNHPERSVAIFKTKSHRHGAFFWIPIAVIATLLAIAVWTHFILEWPKARGPMDNMFL